MSEYANVSGAVLEIGGGRVLAPGQRAELDEPPRRLIESGRLVEVDPPKPPEEPAEEAEEKKPKPRAKRGKSSASEKETD